MEALRPLGRPLADPITSDSIEAAIQEDLRGLAGAPGVARPVARPSVMTLIAVGLDSAGVQRIVDSIDHLARLHPSRTIVLLPDWPVDGPDLRVWHNPVCIDSSNEGFLVCGDQIAIRGRGRAIHHLPSLADQLALPGLPVFLWWAADFVPAYDELFDRVIDFSDRLIVDSSNFKSLGSSTARLARVACRRHNPCIPSDLNWSRLVPWRDVLAQLFETGATRAALAEIDQLVVTYDPSDPAGPAQTLLLIAWLAGRLGWRPEASPRVSLPGAAGESIPTRLRRPRGEVTLVIQPSTTAGCALTGVALTSAGRGRFSVTRSNNCVQAVVEANVAEGHSLHHNVGFETPDRSDLLGAELMVYGRDRVYEETLDLASALTDIGVPRDRIPRETARQVSEINP